MTGAGVALALALLVAPSAPRQRLRALQPVAAQRRRVPVLPCVVLAVVGLVTLVPVTVVASVVVLATTVGLRRRRHLRQRRRAEESATLQAALEVLVGELRVGAHPVTAFRTAAGEVDGPVAVSLGAVAARAGLGADVTAGLRSVAQHSAVSHHWERLAVCWQLAQTQGLAIATLMRAAHRDIAERERFRARVDARMAGARTTAAVLAGLPVLGIGLGQLIGAEPVKFLLSDGVGGWLLVIGVTLACAGLAWSDRITSRVMK